MKLESLKPSHWKKGFWNRIIIYSRPFLSDEAYLKLKFKHCVGYPLNLENPQTFNEKLQWLKLNDIHPEYTKMVDKATAKDYVASIIGEKYIIPTLGIWNSVEEIEWGKLPNQFVVKSTSDSGGVVVCKDKNKFNQKEAIKKLKNLGERDYYHYNLEYPYKDVPHRYIAEAYMEDNLCKELKDYKFYVFNGRTKYCQVISNRATNMSMDFFDKEWNHQPFHKTAKYLFSQTPIECPSNYHEMWQISEKLANGIPFIRVDLYNINGKVYFGELTFFPASGMGAFDPVEWDYKFGEMIKLPESKESKKGLSMSN